MLVSEGLHPAVLQLDVDSTESIQLASKTVREKYGQLDVLVNNAAIMLKVRDYLNWWVGFS